MNIGAIVFVYNYNKYWPGQIINQHGEDQYELKMFKFKSSLNVSEKDLILYTSEKAQEFLAATSQQDPTYLQAMKTAERHFKNKTKVVKES